jgi:chloride channel 7
VTHGLYRGLTTAFIGVTVGLIGFILHLLIDGVNDTKWSLTRHFIDNNDIQSAWLVTTGYSLAFVFFSTMIVTFYRPSASGSGIPELMGFLNGAMMRHIFNIKTLIVKFLSCVAAVGSGLPIGEEGPMIHIGSLVGAGVSQFKSDTLGLNFRLLRHFRNANERRNFVKAGAAAGVSSAFHAPIGGLLFVMEEVSTLWRLTLTWQTFFCSMLATFTTSLFSSAFSAFVYSGVRNKLLCPLCA